MEAIKDDCNCSRIFSDSTKRYKEDSTYAKICNQCGGYQRHPPRQLVLPETDNLNEILSNDEDKFDFDVIVEDVPHVVVNPERQLKKSKLSTHQKNMMRGYAEDVLKWRIDGHDREDLERFCLEIGVTSVVFKIWYKNNREIMLSAGLAAGDGSGYGAGEGSGIVGSG